MGNETLYNFFVAKKSEIYPLLKLIVGKAGAMLPEGECKKFYQDNTDFFTDMLYRCILEQSIQCVYNSGRELAIEELRSAVRKWLVENFRYGVGEFRIIIIGKLEDIAVEMVVFFQFQLAGWQQNRWQRMPLRFWISDCRTFRIKMNC